MPIPFEFSGFSQKYWRRNRILNGFLKISVAKRGANSSRLFLLTILLIYISISHIFLPVFKVRRSFLIFARWNMFSFLPNKSINDITWDEGQSFLLRDYRKKAAHSGVSIARIFYLFYMGKTIKLPRYLREQIINFCKCQNFDVVLLEGSLSHHIIYKKRLKILKKRHWESATMGKGPK